MANKKHSQAPLKIVPLGGLGEIGMNCMILEYEDEIFVVDCGVLFSDLQTLGVDFFIPDFTYLKERKDKVKGYIVTHAHEDHIGALPYALRSCPAPVYATPFAQKLISSKLEEHELLDATEIHDFIVGKTVKFKHFQITPHYVNHSIVEALALCIDTPQGLIVHTGDFKIDACPFYGAPMDPKPFQEAAKKGVRLLLSDSTNVERDGHSLSEQNVYKRFDEIFSATKGLTVVAIFASNIGRIGQIIELAKKHKKKVAFLGRSMEQNADHARSLGYLEGLEEVNISLDQVNSFPRTDVIILSTGSQGEYRSGLVRLATNEYKGLKLVDGDLVIMSSRFIPGNEKAISRMINSIFRLGADVIYESIAQVHVSGHANAEELTLMMHYVKPEYFIPVHGEYRHLVKHRRLAVKNGILEEKTLVVENNDVVELSQDGLKIVDRLESVRVMIEGATGGDVSKVTLKDRRKVAETGIVFAVLVRNEVTGELMAGPDIMTQGSFDVEQHPELIEESKIEVVDILRECEKRVTSGHNVDLQEEVRIGLRRFYNNRIGKKPVVMTILVEI